MRSLTAILPSGRVAALRRVSPALATASETNEMLRQAERAGEQRLAVNGLQRARLARLKRSLEEDTRRLNDAQLAKAREQRRRLVAASERLDRRLAQELGALRATTARQLRRQSKYVFRLGRREHWDQLVLATSVWLSAAFAQPGDPLDSDNLSILLSALLWLVGDEAAQAIGGSRNELPDALRDPDVWAYLAPIGNLLTGWWLLHDRQHLRFVTGFAKLRPRRHRSGCLPCIGKVAERGHLVTAQVDLQPLLAPGHVEDFASFLAVPAVACVSRFSLALAGAPVELRDLTAHVEGLTLTITATLSDPGGPELDAERLSAAISALEIAWMVDTKNSRCAQRPTTK